MMCRDLVAFQTRYVILDHFNNRTKSNSYLVQLVRQGNLLGVEPGENDTLKDRLLLKMIQNVQPVDCAFDSIVEELSAGSSSFTIGPNSVAFNYLEKLQKIQVENLQYRIQDSNGLFRPYRVVTCIHSISVAREKISRLVRTFEESGIGKQTDSEKESFFVMLRVLKRRYGSMITQPSVVGPISMKTSTYFIFIAYLYLISSALVIFMFEIFAIYISNLT